MQWKHLFVLILLLARTSVPVSGGGVEPDPAAHQWASSMGVSEPRRFYQVSEELYRGGHVTRAGAEQLRCAGINTVVSLRLVGRDEKFITRAGLNYVHIPFKVRQPDEDQVVQFLRIVANSNCQPVYVCCYHGSDRTGMMCAVYRVVVQGWTKEEALCEMTEGPFDYHSKYKEVVQFVRDMDVDRIKRRAGLD
jgi:protein tyrosine phosphatase (PTP) superfamily phosphohydrolase (DUF442 family)